MKLSSIVPGAFFLLSATTLSVSAHARDAFAFGPIRRWDEISFEAIVEEAKQRTSNVEALEEKSSTGEIAPERTMVAGRVSRFSAPGLPFVVHEYWSWPTTNGGRTWVVTISHVSNYDDTMQTREVPPGIAGRSERVVDCGEAIVLVEEREMRESSWFSEVAGTRPVQSAPWQTRITRLDTVELHPSVRRGRVDNGVACSLVTQGGVRRRAGATDWRGSTMSSGRGARR